MKNRNLMILALIGVVIYGVYFAITPNYTQNIQTDVPGALCYMELQSTEPDTRVPNSGYYEAGSDGIVHFDLNSFVAAGIVMGGDPYRGACYCPGGTSGGASFSGYIPNLESTKKVVVSNCGTSPTIPSSCSDSDGGIKYETKGAATENGLDFTDSCNGRVLTEWYCDGGQAKSVDHVCDTCSNGRCVSSPTTTKATTTLPGVTTTLPDDENNSNNQNLLIVGLVVALAALVYVAKGGRI